MRVLPRRAPKLFDGFGAAEQHHGPKLPLDLKQEPANPFEAALEKGLIDVACNSSAARPECDGLGDVHAVTNAARRDGREPCIDTVADGRCRRDSPIPKRFSERAALAFGAQRLDSDPRRAASARGVGMMNPD